MVRKSASITEEVTFQLLETMDYTTNHIKERFCPSCSSQNQTVLFTLSMAKVFQVNPTYHEAWFSESSISPDFEFPIVKCNECGFVFSRFRMKDEIAFSYYNEGIDAQKSQEKIFKKEKRTSFLEIWRNLNLISDKQDYAKVLDFGAGWGDFLAIAKSPGVEVFGLEFDERKIAFAQSQGVLAGDIQFIKKNAPYDIFMCNQVLEHLNQPKEALEELRGVLRIGAVGFISVPNFDEPVIDQQLSLLNSGLPAKKDVDPLGHLNYFTPQHLRKMVSDAGFEEISFPSTQNVTKSLLSSLYNSLKKNTQEKPGTSIYVRAV